MTRADLVSQIKILGVYINTSIGCYVNNDKMYDLHERFIDKTLILSTDELDKIYERVL